jgi:hypothetical protein
VQHDPDRKSHKIGIGSRGRRIPHFSTCFTLRAVNGTGQSVRSSQLIPIFLVNIQWDESVHQAELERTPSRSLSKCCPPFGISKNSVMIVYRGIRRPLK